MKPLPLALILLALNIMPSIFEKTFAQPGNAFSRGAGFVENKGQITDQFKRKNAAVKFLLSLPGGLNIQLRNNGYSYDTYRKTDSSGINKAANYSFHRVDIEFVGANPAPQILTQDTLPFHYTYNTAGNDNLRVGIYGKVVYKNLYPFIDLVFERTMRKDSTGSVEYYFIVHPGGDASAIRWKYKGGKMSKLGNGHITIDLENRQLKEHIPMSYLGGPSTQTNLSVRYKQTGTDAYGFQVPAYDRKHTLTIDPTPDLVWGTYYGTSYEAFTGIARQTNGNVVVEGTASDPGLATAGAYQTTIAAYADVLIAAFTKNGALLWATYFGGEAYDRGTCIAIDANNNIFVGGNTGSYTGIATPGAYKTTRPGNGVNNAFLAKFDQNGSRIWATYYGSNTDDDGNSVAIDQNNNIVFAGTGILNTSVFSVGTLAKFDQSGALVWNITYGNKRENFRGVTVGPDNNIIVTGDGYSSSLATPGTYQTTLGGVQDNTFLAKFSATGSLIWGTYYGTNGQYGSGTCVTTDLQGNIYAGGSTNCTGNISTPGVMQGTYVGSTDGFVAKFNKNGGLLWGTYCGSNGYDVVQAISTDGVGGVWVTGALSGQSVAITPGSYQPTLSGASSSVFLTMLNSSGTRLWGTYYGISTFPSESGRGVVNDGNGNVFLTGETSAVKNISTCGAVQLNLQGHDGFVAQFGKLDPAVSPGITISADHAGILCQGTPVVFTASYQNGGVSPSFTWLVNDRPVSSGSDRATLGLSDGDVVTCTMDIHSTCGLSLYNSNSLSFTVNAGTTPTIAIQTATTTICSAAATHFTAVAGNAGSQPVYQWYINGIKAGANSPGFVTNSLADGDIVSCMLTKQDICSLTPTALSNAITLSVRQTPIKGFSINATNGAVCQGSPVTFTAAVTNAGNLSYQWQVNGVSTGGDAPTFTSTGLNNGDMVECVLKVNDNLCAFPAINSNTLTETIYPVPDLLVTGDTLLTRGTAGQLYARVGNVNSGLNYIWTPAGTLNSFSIPNPVALPLKTTSYTVEVATDKGCTAKGSITVHLITMIIPPNAFSPNGDGNNDVFRIQYESDISDIHFYIYNRWGQLLFVDEGSHKGWDGRFGGTPQPLGTYTWIFQYKDRESKMQILKGMVELIR